MADQEPSWYRQALNEQAWENYRNEDDNYRSTVTQYLVFTAAIVYAASQAKAATAWLGVLGLVVSVATVLYLGRITRYSRRWLIAKDAALTQPIVTEELNHRTQAGEQLGVLAKLTAIPGYVLTIILVIAGTVIFVAMICRGPGLWGP